MDKEIIVIGGGIGGMAAALALARTRAARARCSRRRPSSARSAMASRCGPNVHRMLDHLGVMKDIEPHAFYPKGLVMADAMSGGEVARIDLGKWFRERYGRPYFVVHRRDLHGALWDACKASDKISLERLEGASELSRSAAMSCR